jgi:hypothetical protein
MHIHMLENRVVDLESQVRALEYRLHEVEKALMNLINEAVAEVICPDGGTIDESIARDAMLEAIAEVAEDDPGAFDELSTDQLDEFLCDVITRSIVTKVLNEIGTNALHGSASDADFREAEQITRDFTQGRVRDALGNRFDAGSRPTQSEIDRSISDVYADTFDMLGAVLETMQ